MKTYTQLLNPSNSLLGRIVLGGIDLLLTGGYQGRYDDRVKEYNAGKITYTEFANSNFADVLATSYATQVTFGVGKITSVAAAGK